MSVVTSAENDNACAIDGGTFCWTDEQPLLKEINLVLPKGSLTAVVGMVGSGKSSLLSAILGEMKKTQGNLAVHESIAYVPQEAWIQNMSLRSNIFFFSNEYRSGRQV